MDDQTKICKWIGKAIRTALEGVAEPMSVLIETIILPYCAGDRSFAVQYYRLQSEDQSKSIAALQQTQRETNAMATLNRYPSFILDDWLQRTDPASMVRYSIEYVTVNGKEYQPGCYSYFQVMINGIGVVDFEGCPSDSFSGDRQFTIRTSWTYLKRMFIWKSIEDYINDQTEYRLEHLRPMLLEFSKTGIIDIWPTQENYELIVVVHTYYRLTQLVRKYGCIRCEYNEKLAPPGKNLVACIGCRKQNIWSLNDFVFPYGLADLDLEL